MRGRAETRRRMLRQGRWRRDKLTRIMLPALVLGLMLSSWVQVRSETYVVKSSAGEERAKKVLTELESFHQLLGSFIFGDVNLPELPIEVLLIGDEATMNDLRPEYSGRKLDVAGYFQKGTDRDFIVLSGRFFPGTLTRIVYHELTHYFLTRSLADRPVWVNEGLAEYFATAEIEGDDIYLAAQSPERLQTIKTGRLLPLAEFFAVDAASPYYNESFKANIFYAQAWAFVHYLMHSEHEQNFRRYLAALSTGEADLFGHLNVTEKELEYGFRAYLSYSLQRSVRTQIKAPSGGWTMKIESIAESDALMSMAEIFLANGKHDEARRRLELLFASGDELPRASYYRGVLARLSGEPEARDWFIDALTDPQLGASAAVQLVRMGDVYIPAVKSVLEDAVARGTRASEVYGALAEIHYQEMLRVAESLKKTIPPLEEIDPDRIRESDPSWAPTRYAEGATDRVRFKLLSDPGRTPQVQFIVPPQYPAELIDQKLSGEVIVDLQLTDDGDVAGMWLVSATPDFFASLATAAVRQWRFEPISVKIRVVLEFTP